MTYAKTPARLPAALLVALVLSAGCSDITVPNYNQPSLEQLRQNPTRTGVTTAATGLLIGARSNLAGPNAYVSLLGILGRESYNFDGSEPRFITEMLVGPMSPSGAFGGNLWAARYQNIRNANIVMEAAELVPEFSAQEREAIRGFAKTMQALDFLLVINTRDANGAPVDVDRPLSAEPAPLVDRAGVLAHVIRLLNEADGHLAAAGSSFPFPLSSGFSGFSTPESFRQFNRALLARTQVYAGNYVEALTALQNSFVSRSEPLTRGVYHNYSSGSGETPNNLIAATIRAHPSIVADAEMQPGGAIDQRVQDKTASVPLLTQQGVGSDLGFTIYSSPSSPVPIIRNEELILLRAEARWFTNDREGALADLNFIRQSSGGLAPIGMPADDAEFVTELLRQRRYSLLFEGHRWIDLRRFGRLGTLPLDLPSHTRQERFPIPEAECLARGQATCQA